MKILYNIILVLLITSLFNACKKNEISDNQSKRFVKLFGNSGIDEGKGVIQTDDGGYLVAGNTTIENIKAVYVAKTDKYGNLLWDNTFADTVDNEINDICSDNNGNFWLVGSDTKSDGYTDILIMKISSTGDTLLKKSIGTQFNDIARSVAIFPSGGAIVVGSVNYSSDSHPDSTDVYYIKVSDQGDSLWSKTAGADMADAGVDVVVNDDESFVIVGNTSSFSTASQAGQNIIVIPVRSDGFLLGMANYGGMGDEQASAIVRTPQGGYIIVGATSSSGAGASDMYVVNLGEDVFSSIWETTIGFQNDDVANDIIIDDNTIYVSGTIEDNNTGNQNAAFYSLDMSGNETLLAEYGSDGVEAFNKMTLTSDGGVVLTGISNIEDNGMLVLVKTLPKEELY